MKAKFQDHFSTKRQKLHEVIPLDTPFTLSIEPITFCNLRCNFCIYSLPKEEMIKAGHVFSAMELGVFDMLICQLKIFPRPLKVISFIGEGEPLLHKALPYMIEQLSHNRLAENIQVLTNGTLLTKQLSVDLVNAGVNTIKVSVNGLSSDEYLENCGVRIEFNKFLDGLRFLYEHKRNAQVLIKTVTSVLKGRREEEFFELFGDYCDKISVENTMPYFPGVSYDNIIVQSKKQTSRYSSLRRTARICAAPFFRMSVKYDGTVKVCGCRSGIVVDKNIENLFQAWNSSRHKEIMLRILCEKYEDITEPCNRCFSRNDFAFDEDNLDLHVDEVYNKIIKL